MYVNWDLHLLPQMEMYRERYKWQTTTTELVTEVREGVGEDITQHFPTWVFVYWKK